MRDEPSLKRLASFLEEHAGYSIVQLHGLVTAIASGPDSDKDWLTPLVQRFGPLPTDTLQQLIDDIMWLHDTTQQQLEAMNFNPLITFDDTSDWPLARIMSASRPWVIGYLSGIAFDKEAWTSGGQLVMVLLQPLVVLGLPEDKIQSELRKLLQSEEDSNEELRDHLLTIINVVPCFMRCYWQTTQRTSNDDSGKENGVVDMIAQADCPCGSGKRFQACCLHKDGVTTLH